MRGGKERQALQTRALANPPTVRNTPFQVNKNPYSSLLGVETKRDPGVKREMGRDREVE